MKLSLDQLLGPSSSAPEGDRVGTDRPPPRAPLGTYVTFRKRILQQLPLVTLPDPSDPAKQIRPLARIDTGDDRNNFVVALASAWATSLDILAFYQQRVADGAYIGTASDARSQVELTRQVGHDIAPATASTTWLAITVRAVPGQPLPLALDAGIAVQSIAPPGADPSAGPQVFETTASITARPEWNAMPLLAPPPAPAEVAFSPAAPTACTFASPASPLAPGEPVVVLGTDSTGATAAVIASIGAVTVDPSGTTATSLTPAAGTTSGSIAGPSVVRLRKQAKMLGADAPVWSQLGIDTQRRYAWMRGGLEMLLAPASAATTTVTTPASTGAASATASTSTATTTATTTTGTPAGTSAPPATPAPEPRSRAPVDVGLPAVPIVALTVHPKGSVVAAVQGKGIYTAPLSAVTALASTLHAGQITTGSIPKEPWPGTPADQTSPWTAASTGLTRRDVTCLAMDAQGTLYAGTVGGGVYRSTNAATSWDEIGRGTTVVTTTTIGGQQAYVPTRRGVPEATVLAVAAGVVGFTSPPSPPPASGGTPAGTQASGGSSPSGSQIVSALTPVISGVLSAAGLGVPASIVGIVGRAIGSLLGGGGSGAPSGSSSPSASTMADAVTNAVHGALAESGQTPPAGLAGAVSKAVADAKTAPAVAAATTAGLAITFDGGATWFPCTGLPAGLLLRSVAIEEASGHLVAGTSGGMYLLSLTCAADTTTGSLTLTACSWLPLSSTLPILVKLPPAEVTQLAATSAPVSGVMHGQVVFALHGEGVFVWSTIGTNAGPPMAVPAGGAGAAAVATGTNAGPPVATPASGADVAAVAMWPPALWASVSPAPNASPILLEMSTQRLCSRDAGLTWTALAVSPSEAPGPASALALAGDQSALVALPPSGFDPDDWPGMTQPGPSLDLSSVTQGILPQSTVLLAPAAQGASASTAPAAPAGAAASTPATASAPTAQAFSVSASRTASITRFGTAQTVTQVDLAAASAGASSPVDLSAYSPRTTAVLLQSEALSLLKNAPDPATDAVPLQAVPATSTPATTGTNATTGTHATTGTRAASPPSAATAAPDPATPSTSATPPPSGPTLSLASPVPAMEAGRTIIVQGKLHRASLPSGTQLQKVGPDGTATDQLVAAPSPVFVASWTWPAPPTAGAAAASVTSALDGATVRFVDAQGLEYALSSASGLALAAPQAADPTFAEVATIAASTGPDASTCSKVTLSAPLSRAYAVSTVTLLGNVAPAGHGSTVSSVVLGSGDATRTYQTFTLPDTNLTMEPGAPGEPPTSTLVVSVNGIPWTEVDDLGTAGPSDTCYTVDHGADGTTTVSFGDGVHGARLPTGTGNVTASYRTGSGPTGHLGAGALKVLLRRPLGVVSAINPVETTEAQEAEAPADAVSYVLATGQVTDHIVTPADYEYLTLSFPGVAKVHVETGTERGHRAVFVTIARTPGTSRGPDDDAAFLDALRAYLSARRLPAERRTVRLDLAIARTRYFGVRAVVTPAPGADGVGLAAVESLSAAFGFDQRAIGQATTMSHVLAVLQRTAGVLGAYLLVLDRVADEGAPPPETSSVESLVLAGIEPDRRLSPGQVPSWLAAWGARGGRPRPELLLFGGPGSAVIQEGEAP